MMTPDLYFWARLLGRVAVEAACVAGAALLLERLVRPAFWRRALWQGAVVCLLLLTASEMSGFGRGLAAFLFGRARPEQRYAVRLRSVESAPLPPPAPATTVAPAAVIVPLAAAKPEIVREVWWPGLLWLAGALAVLGRAGAAQVLFISLRRRRPILVDSDLNGRVAAILRRLNVRGKIRLLQSPGLTGPIAFGILRPSVGLPVDFAVKFSRAEQDAMLAHELAHLASRDPLWYLLADASSAALWWHPQAWWARRRLHRASELAADEAATMFPDGPAVLAGCLVTLGRQMTRFPAASRMGVEGGGFRSNLAERVQRLLRLAESARQPSYGWRSHAARFAAILTLSAAAIALSGCLQSRPAEKQPTLQANISEAWAESPAATVWHSALPQKRAEAPSAPKRVFTQLASQDKSAIVEAIRETVSLGIGEFHVEPKSFVLALRRLFPNDAGGQPIALLNRYVAGAGIDMTNANSFILFNPRTGDILARGTARNLDSLEQAIDLLKEIPPVDSVDRAGELVNKSRTNGFFFLHPQPEKAWLETGQLVQMIHVDSNTFLQGMREVFPQIPARQANPDVAVAGGVRYSPKENEDFLDSDWLSRCFASLGINFTNNGIHVFFNIGRSDVLARETLAMYDITAVHEVMELLNKAPAQVRIDAKFVSVAENDANVFGFLSYLGNFTTNPGAIGARAGSGPSYPGTTTVANPSGIFPGASPTGSNAMSNAALPAITGILTEPQFRAAIQAIEQRDGTKILAVPGITTESGRQARMAVADNFEIPTNATSGTNGGSTRTPPVEGGPVLDVIPTVSANGFTIQLSLTAGLQEFTGYESTAQIPANAAPLVPRFRNFSATNLINVWDGETALIGGLVEENAPGRNQSTNSQRRNLMVFVTARIVDPAGKPVHTDEDMPFAKASIPPQPPFSPPK